MRIEVSIPHIRTGVDDFGQVWVQVDDTELFDYVEDFLIEEHNLEYLSVCPSDKPGRPTSFTMTFEGTLASKVRAAVSSLDPKKVQEIYLLNNPEHST